MRKKFFIVLVGLVVIIFISFFIYPSSWDGTNRLTIATLTEDGDIALINIDPKNNFITTITIPYNTQIDTARDLGIWQIGTLWELGYSEGYKGKLLSDSVMKTFHLPIEAWGSNSIFKLLDGNLLSALVSISTRDTNLTLKDKMRLMLVSLRASSNSREVIKMEDTNFLELTVFPGGKSGYRVRNEVPQSLVRIFSDDIIADEQARIKIINVSGENLATKEISSIAEVLGTKVVSAVMENNEEIDCEVAAKKTGAITQSRISHIFSCLETELSEDAIHDVQIKVGTDFIKRF